MLSSFSEISKDSQRDEITQLDKEVSKLIDGNASSNKQIFTFIYHNIFLSIDAMAGHLDIMGEMYSEFLKYALGDGKEIGIVLTPPYITKMMATILNVNMNSRVMDLATGSA
jgi:type I restriction-modification system DNA methylase subunit